MREECFPSVENLIKIAEILDVSIHLLVGHNSNIVDLNTLNENQKKVVNIVVEELEDNNVAKSFGIY